MALEELALRMGPSAKSVTELKDRTLMAELSSKLAVIKTKLTSSSMEESIYSIQNEQKHKNSFDLVDIMKNQLVKSLPYAVTQLLDL
jgi:hypothetical protein